MIRDPTSSFAPSLLIKLRCHSAINHTIPIQEPASFVLLEH